MTACSLLELDLSYLADLETLLREVSSGPGTINTNHERQIHRASTARQVALDELKQKHNEATEALHSQLQSDLSSLKSDMNVRLKRAGGRRKIKRDSILDNQEIVHSKAAEKAGHDEWLAESIYEAGTKQAEEELRLCAIHDDSVQERVRLTGEQIEAHGYRKAVSTESSSSTEPFSEDDIEQMLDAMETLIESLQEKVWERSARTLCGWLAPLLGLACGWGVAHLAQWSGANLWSSLGIGGLIGLLATTFTWLSRRSSRLKRLRKISSLGDAASAASSKRRSDLEATFQTHDLKHRTERDQTIDQVHGRLQERLEGFSPNVQNLLEQLDEAYHNDCNQIKSEYELAVEEKKTTASNTQQKLDESLQSDTASIEQRHQNAIANADTARDQKLKELQAQWAQERPRLQSVLQDIMSRGSASDAEWTDPSCLANLKDQDRVTDIHIGKVHIDRDALGQSIPSDFEWDGPNPIIDLPAAIDLDVRGGMVIKYDRAHREDAMSLVRSTLLRLLALNQPGMTKLTLVDPIGLGETFAGFMHLADLEDGQILSKVWTEATHLNQQLEHISAHMETVIQSLLRNEFDSLSQYNMQAGAVAEPYHILVLADFPSALNDAAAQRLASILTSGQRCGVLTFILQDADQPIPEPLVGVLDDFPSVRIQHDKDAWRITDPPLERFAFRPDSAPPADLLTHFVQQIGEAAHGAHRVEVPFEQIAPDENQIWSRSTANDIRVELGPSGANRLREFVLGPGTTQHALIAGRTGSGKSTLLHVLITNLAMWYSPEEIEFYLVDFKKGVEFQTYATNALPHARVIAIESDREFGLSVLRGLDEELRRRGQLFRDAGVQDVPSWREQDLGTMPRIMLVVDEFQEFFIDDDTVAQEAGMLLDRLVRQGRAFGIHVLMGSQTLGGAFSLARSTMGQIGVRIALQCDESDSYLILSDDNPAARQLRRPGEAIYNDTGGKIDGNAPFQVAWLDDATRDQYLAMLPARSKGPQERQFVFRGNIPSILPDHPEITPLLNASTWPTDPDLHIQLGDPIAIKRSTFVPMQRQSASNIMLVGQHSECAQAIQIATLLQAAAVLRPTENPQIPGLMVWLLDGLPPDASFGGRLANFAQQLPHQVTRVSAQNAEEELQRLGNILTERQADPSNGATILLLGLDTHRLSALRPKEDDFMMSMREDEPVHPAKHLADLLRDGPALGIHSLLWFDALNNMLRGLDRASQRMFGYRVLFQMSSADSGQLIDTTAASELGLQRALLHQEDTGSIDKFRPWAMPDASWLEQVAQALHVRHQKA
ncbi:MAG: hypothetical protein MK077_02230 [Phycisphaerales bacterium]|nr:hypothetical protein [Phycisphaerales bacterium]